MMRGRTMTRVDSWSMPMCALRDNGTCLALKKVIYWKNTQNVESSHYIKFDKNKQKFYCTFPMFYLQHWVLRLQKVWQITLHPSNISLINKHMKTVGSEHSGKMV